MPTSKITGRRTVPGRAGAKARAVVPAGVVDQVSKNTGISKTKANKAYSALLRGVKKKLEERGVVTLGSYGTFYEIEAAPAIEGEPIVFTESKILFAPSTEAEANRGSAAAKAHSAAQRRQKVALG